STAIVSLGSNALRIAVETNSLALAGAINGSAPITKTGDGVLVLNASNTFSGTLTISEGELQANRATVFGASTNLVVVDGPARLHFEPGASGTIAQNFRLGGTIISEAPSLTLG